MAQNNYNKNASYPRPTTHRLEAIEKWIDVHLTLTHEQYSSEVYDVFLDKMIHQLNGVKNPYESGHPLYNKCPVCPNFTDIVVRRYSKVDVNGLTQFTISIVFPKKIYLKISVEEKILDEEKIQIHFQVDAFIIRTSYMMMKRPVKLQDFLLSWMNSILLELQNQSTKIKEKDEFENIENEALFSALDTLCLKCNSYVIA